MPLSPLGQRIATAVVLVPLVLAALWLLSARGWALVTLAIAIAGANEWAKLVGYGTARRALFVAATLGLGLALLFAGPAGFDEGWPPRVVLVICGSAILFWLLVAPAWLAKRWPTSVPLPMAIVGAVVLIAAWVALVELQSRSPWLVLAAMAAVWIADTAAYFVGRRFGRRKLAPAISPGKSWEGVWGGLAAVALYAFALMPFAADAGYAGTRGAIAAIAFVIFAMALVAISVVGDLYESLLKRQAGVKDSGALLPGHGGVLDRVDALLAAMPAAAFAATLFLPKDGA